MSPSELARKRAQGCFNHIAMTVRLGREHGQDARALAAWNLGMFADHGYYEEWGVHAGHGNVDAFLQEFLSGREMLYDACQVVATADGYEVTSRLWYHEDPPELLFYLDLEPEDISAYVVELGQENARRCGVALELTHEGGVERARIRPLAGGV